MQLATLPPRHATIERAALDAARRAAHDLDMNTLRIRTSWRLPNAHLVLLLKNLRARASKPAKAALITTVINRIAAS